MFWKCVIAAAVAIGLIKLGALSVLVVVLRAMLFVVLAAVFAVGLVFAWRRYRSF